MAYPGKVPMIVARQPVNLRPVTTFHVLPDRLTTTAGSLNELADETSAMGAAAEREPVPLQVFARIPEATTLWVALATSASRCWVGLDEIAGSMRRTAAGTARSGEGYAAADAQVARSYRQSLHRA